MKTTPQYLEALKGYARLIELHNVIDSLDREVYIKITPEKLELWLNDVLTDYKFNP